MLRAMYSGISGISGFQTKLDVIGNNIANVNTAGFKKGRTTFEDLVSQQMAGASTPTDNRGGTNPIQVGLGGTTATVDTVHTQGSLQNTGRDLDLGISGDGFFVVNDGLNSFYTRAGNFYLDQQGNLVNSNGYLVQGYGIVDDEVDEAGGIGPLNISSGATIPPVATTEADIRGNLNSGTEIGESRDVRFYVVDEIGREHLIEIEFTKSANNLWEYSISSDEFDIAGGSTGTLDFVSGNLTDDLTNITLQLNDPNIEDVAFEIDFSQMTQYERPSSAELYNINGNLDGTLESYSVSPKGEIFGVFSNGQVNILGQIALATFNNPGGLTKTGQNLYQLSSNSGVPRIGFPGEGGRGEMTGATLEMSNVDLSEEFTEMIVAQRGFQANTRIITTSDEILQELVNLKR
ncbi:flagellar hook protein FlgE [Evansella sp. AB-P1]|uniref:flagellar hook protein FlgE n=1 Tax=Evansella sp. AB-P1 TaxID=3037653 RepID=UPI00241DB6B0|nr:flagellar hook protein FlgE [Evansella sp. AB-P1]MDG5788184.1 flagellar hook protein FlgE [Evansella sp. AB-P1]